MNRQKFLILITCVAVVAGVVWAWPTVNRSDAITPERAAYIHLIARSADGDRTATRKLYEDARGSSASVIGEGGAARMWLQLLALQGDESARQAFVSYFKQLPVAKQETELAAIVRAKQSGHYEGVDQLLLALKNY